MNNTIQEFARNEIKSGLALLSDSHRHMFKRMYSHGNLDVDINAAVDNMDEGKLATAMEQVQKSVKEFVK